MNGMVELLSTPIAQRVGWALLHFLWQGTVVALLLAVLLQLLRRRSPQVRWAASCLALAVMAALPAVTACVVSVDRPEPAPIVEPSTAPHPSEAAVVGMERPPSPILSPVSPPPVEDSAPVSMNSSSELPARAAHQCSAKPWLQRVGDLLRPFLPWAVVAWLVGVTGMSLWHLGGWLEVRRLKHSGTRPTDSTIRDAFGRLLQRLRVRRCVRLLESVRVAVPVVAGWLRPVILLPASPLFGLSTTQLEAVLTHELAHIRRWDCLVRLLQAAVETLLFYHPAVWWVSRRIREESENCCDDIAAKVCGDRKGYARALAGIAELGRAAPSLAAAASGGRLLPRIRRVLGLPAPHRGQGASWVAGRSSWHP